VYPLFLKRQSKRGLREGFGVDFQRIKSILSNPEDAPHGHRMVVLVALIGFGNRVQSWQELAKFAVNRPKLAI
jgi:hypothetical protein